MNKFIKIVIFGFFIWLIPFIVSVILFSLRDSNRILFESIMPVVLTTTVISFSILYFKKVNNKFTIDGIIIGIIWFVISIFIDIIMFFPESPMQMTIADYTMDIGITYLIILVIPISMGYLIEKK